MEHLLHIFGGGCGEHAVLPLIGTAVAGLGLYWVALKGRVQRIWARVRGSK